MSRVAGVGTSSGSLGPGGALQRSSRSDQRLGLNVGIREDLNTTRVSAPNVFANPTAELLRAVAGGIQGVDRALGERIEELQQRPDPVVGAGVSEDALDPRVATQAQIGEATRSLAPNMFRVEMAIQSDQIAADPGSEAEVAARLVAEQTAGLAPEVQDALKARLTPEVEIALIRRNEARSQQAAAETIDRLTVAAVSGEDDGSIEDAYAAALAVDPNLDANRFFLGAAEVAVAQGNYAALESLMARIDPGASGDDAVSVAQLRDIIDDRAERQILQDQRQQADSVFESVDAMIFDIQSGRHGMMGGLMAIDALRNAVDDGIIEPRQAELATNRVQAAIDGLAQQARRDVERQQLMMRANDASRVGRSMTTDEARAANEMIGAQYAAAETRADQLAILTSASLMQGKTGAKVSVLSQATSFGVDQIDLENSAVGEQAILALENFQVIKSASAHTASNVNKGTPEYEILHAASTLMEFQTGMDPGVALMRGRMVYEHRGLPATYQVGVTRDDLFEGIPNNLADLLEDDGFRNEMVLDRLVRQAEIAVQSGHMSREQAIHFVWNKVGGDFAKTKGGSVIHIGDLDRESQTDVVEALDRLKSKQFPTTTTTEIIDSPVTGPRSRTVRGPEADLQWRRVGVGGAFVLTRPDGTYAGDPVSPQQVMRELDLLDADRARAEAEADEARRQSNAASVRRAADRADRIRGSLINQGLTDISDEIHRRLRDTIPGAFN